MDRKGLIHAETCFRGTVRDWAEALHVGTGVIRARIQRYKSAMPRDLKARKRYLESPAIRLWSETCFFGTLREWAHVFKVGKDAIGSRIRTYGTALPRQKLAGGRWTKLTLTQAD